MNYQLSVGTVSPQQLGLSILKICPWSRPPSIPVLVGTQRHSVIDSSIGMIWSLFLCLEVQTPASHFCPPENWQCWSPCPAPFSFETLKSSSSLPELWTMYRPPHVLMTWAKWLKISHRLFSSTLTIDIIYILITQQSKPSCLYWSV